MIRSMDELDPDFRSAVDGVLHACLQRHVQMVVYCTLRTVRQQAVLWRQSRSSGEIERHLHVLREHGANELAEAIVAVGPCDGPPVTNAPPGASWHHYRRAVDAFWLHDDAADWSTRTRNRLGLNGYSVWADCAERSGLVAGGHWKRFKDWPHVQADEDGVLEHHGGDWLRVQRALQALDLQSAKRARELEVSSPEGRPVEEPTWILSRVAHDPTVESTPCGDAPVGEVSA